MILDEPCSWSSTLISSTTWEADRRKPPPETHKLNYTSSNQSAYKILGVGTTFTAGCPDLVWFATPIPWNDLGSVVFPLLFHIEDLCVCIEMERISHRPLTQHSRKIIKTKKGNYFIATAQWNNEAAVGNNFDFIQPTTPSKALVMM